MFKTLETERLVLKRFDYSMLDEAYRLFNTKKLMECMIMEYPYNYAKMRYWPNLFSDTSGYRIAVVEKISGRLLGEVEYNSNRLGYWIGAPYRNKGFAKEAVGAVVNYVLNYDRVESLKANVLKTNMPSRNLLESLGFRLTEESETSFIYTKYRS